MWKKRKETKHSLICYIISNYSFIKYIADICYWVGQDLYKVWECKRRVAILVVPFVSRKGDHT